jgi:hypothetical protein
MSLEKAMDDLRASIDALNKTLGNMKGESSGGSGEAEPRKPRGRPRNPPEGEGNRAEGSRAETSKGDDKAASPDKIRKAFGEYLGVDDDDEYQKRREFVEAILNELGVDKISEAKDDDMRKAYAWLQDKLDGKRVRFDGADDRKRDLV